VAENKSSFPPYCELDVSSSWCYQVLPECIGSCVVQTDIEDCSTAAWHMICVYHKVHSVYSECDIMGSLQMNIEFMILAKI